MCRTIFSPFMEKARINIPLKFCRKCVRIKFMGFLFNHRKKGGVAPEERRKKTGTKTNYILIYSRTWIYMKRHFSIINISLFSEVTIYICVHLRLYRSRKCELCANAVFGAIYYKNHTHTHTGQYSGEYKVLGLCYLILTFPSAHTIQPLQQIETIQVIL